MDAFTDEILDPRRTTRQELNPRRDRGDTIVRGDLILVDVSNYLEGGGIMWVKFLFDSAGSASVYPYKGQIPERGHGQWRASEILGWARPVELHEELRLAAGAHLSEPPTPGEIAELREWIRTRPPKVQAVMERFPPASYVAAKEGRKLLCPAPGEIGIVVSYAERLLDEDGREDGPVLLNVAPRHDPSQCIAEVDPDWVEVVESEAQRRLYDAAKRELALLSL